MTFNGTGPVNAVVQLTNINGEPTVNGINCDSHNFGCEGTGPNGVLQGIQSDCTGDGNDATGGSSNVGDLLDPDEKRTDPVLTEDEEPDKTASGAVSVAWAGTSLVGPEGIVSYSRGIAGRCDSSE